jgi:hypothetical protein
MADPQETSRATGDHFNTSVRFALEDTQPRRIRYHLLRLTVAGLSREDVAELGELARLAFDGLDVAEQTAKIKERSDASPLAFAIADVLEQAAGGVRGPASTRDVMVGAVLGAYTGLGDMPDLPKPVVAIIGAIGGAVAMTGNAAIAHNVDRQAWAEYLRMEE